MRRKVYATFGIAALAASGVAHAATAPKAVRVSMETSDGRDAGEIVLVNEGKRAIKLEVDMQNLDPGAHALHFHRQPSCDAPTFQTAGGRLYEGPHGGNINLNVNVNDAGKAHQTIVVHGFTLDPNAATSVLAHGGSSLLLFTKRNDPHTVAPQSGATPEACGIVSPANEMNQPPRLLQTPPLAAPSNH